jgi:hypothetical protein
MTLKRLSPSPTGWRVVNVTDLYTAWLEAATGVAVLSSTIFAEGRWQYLVSVSVQPPPVLIRRSGALLPAPRRPNDLEARRALEAFGAADFEEDNHSPGIARKFWYPVDGKAEPCPCKEEKLIVEPDGYAWSSPGGDQ